MENESLGSTEVVAGVAKQASPPETTLVRRQPILPDPVRHPFALLWVAALPQLILLLLNLRDYQLVVGEMTPWQRQMSATIGAVELVLLLGSAAIAFVFRSSGRSLPWMACWGLLIAPVLYLWLFLFQVDSVIPRSVIAWILPPEWVVYDQFAFMMPLIFYSLVRIACVDLNVARRVEYGISIGILFLGPLLYFGLTRIPYRWHIFDLFGDVSALIFGTLFVVLTLAMLGAALRLLIIGYLAVNKKGPLALAILAFLIGIAGPIGGLVLNRWIPFPANFQAPAVYVMATLNGTLLLLPNFRNLLLHRAIWLAQCVLFPFTFYFFLVFLPFLLASIPAILYVGAGFLVLTPTALFLTHTQRISHGYRAEIRDGGRLRPALLGLAALCVIPSIYVAGAMFDRFMLKSAIDYIYTPDYQINTRYGGNTVFVRRALEHLRDSKEGLDLPFLSRFYNWIVFDGLVLPDDKMNQIHRAFFGNDLPAQKKSGLFGSPRTRQTFRPVTAAPRRDVSLVNATIASVHAEQNCQRATVLLELLNSSSVQSEFVSAIQVPEGVLISGFWLHIGKDRVPGQLFEQKTAMWVYQMIRDRSRRDPGLLTCKSPGVFELRVFPFSANEQRQVEIEFLYPASLQPAIRLGDQKIEPSGTSQSSGMIVSRSADGRTGLWASSTATNSLPHVNRTPYLHFIVDRSASSDVTSETLNQVIQSARTSFPSARQYKVAAANYEVADLTKDLAPLEGAPITANLEALPRRGGFAPDREMKRALLSYRDELCAAQNGSAPILTTFPVFVIVSGTHTDPLAHPDISTFGKFTPDIAGYYVATNSNEFEPHGFNGEKIEASHALKPVTLFKIGDAVSASASPSSTEPGVMVYFTGSSDSGAVTVFDPTAGTFTTIDKIDTVGPETRYAAGIAAWEEYLESIYNPSLQGKLGEVVRRSRESGILVGGTSYMVVENSAQWKVLAQKQKQKLRNNATLEFEAVPEPSTWLLLILGVVSLGLIARRCRS